MKRFITLLLAITLFYIPSSLAPAGGECNENWDDPVWSTCSSDSTQIRTVTDANSCGTENNKPATSRSCTYTASSTGGGGGGGGGTTDTSGATTVSKKWDKMTVGENTMTVTSTAITLTEIKIKVKAEASNPEVTASKFDVKPSAVTVPAENVYQYLQMTKNTFLTDDNIEDVTFTFEVLRTWLSDNNLDDNTVVMKRWTTEWNDLATTKKSTGTDSITYEATSPGLSYFAVTAEKLPNVTLPVENVTNVTTNVSEVIEEEVVEEVVEEVIEEEEKKPINWAFWIILIIIITFAGVLGYVFYTQKKDGFEQSEEKKEESKEEEEHKEEEKEEKKEESKEEKKEE